MELAVAEIKKISLSYIVALTKEEKKPMKN
jgi:hypothetical protein